MYIVDKYDVEPNPYPGEYIYTDTMYREDIKTVLDNNKLSDEDFERLIDNLDEELYYHMAYQRRYTVRYTITVLSDNDHTIWKASGTDYIGDEDYGTDFEIIFNHKPTDDEVFKQFKIDNGYDNSDHHIEKSILKTYECL